MLRSLHSSAVHDGVRCDGPHLGTCRPTSRTNHELAIAHPCFPSFLFSVTRTVVARNHFGRTAHVAVLRDGPSLWTRLSTARTTSSPPQTRTNLLLFLLTSHIRRSCPAHEFRPECANLVRSSKYGDMGEALFQRSPARDDR